MTVNEKMHMELFTNLEPCMMCLGVSISSFCLPDITSGILETESKELFKRYITIHREGSLVEWAKTIIC